MRYVNMVFTGKKVQNTDHLNLKKENFEMRYENKYAHNDILSNMHPSKFREKAPISRQNVLSLISKERNEFLYTCSTKCFSKFNDISLISRKRG